VLIGVQASTAERGALTEWINQTNLVFPVGAVSGDIDAVRQAWGVKSLPWLILTDEKHKVVAEGFALNELEGKMDDAADR
jgi:hypothetical protein